MGCFESMVPYSTWPFVRASCTQHVSKVRLCGNRHQSFVPFCVREHSTVRMDHVFTYFIFSRWTSGLSPPFGCCDAAESIPVRVFAWTCVFTSLGQILRSVSAGSDGVSRLRCCQAVSKQLCHLTMPPAQCEGCNSSLASPILITAPLFLFFFFFLLQPSLWLKSAISTRV